MAVLNVDLGGGASRTISASDPGVDATNTINVTAIGGNSVLTIDGVQAAFELLPDPWTDFRLI